MAIETAAQTGPGTFFSIQPFWPRQETSCLNVYDDAMNITFQLRELDIHHDYFDSVPGIGLVTLRFSCDPNRPFAYCYGVLESRRNIPNHIQSRVLTCRLRPGDFSRIFHMNCSLLTNREVPLMDLPWMREVAERISLATTIEEQKQMIQNFLRSRYHAVGHPREYDLARHVAALILQAHGNVRIGEIADSTGYSTRRLQQVILNNIGITPKRLCQNVRFQHSLHTLYQSSQSGLMQVALDLGYYDQSHFLREFKSAIRMSPSSFIHSYLI